MRQFALNIIMIVLHRPVGRHAGESWELPGPLSAYAPASRLSGTRDDLIREINPHSYIAAYCPETLLTGQERLPASLPAWRPVASASGCGEARTGSYLVI